MSKNKEIMTTEYRIVREMTDHIKMCSFHGGVCMYACIDCKYQRDPVGADS